MLLTVFQDDNFDMIAENVIGGGSVFPYMAMK